MNYYFRTTAHCASLPFARSLAAFYSSISWRQTGERGAGLTGKPLHYKGSRFHYARGDFCIGGGDITRNNGLGSESIYGGLFPNENFTLKHDGPGVVSMFNTGLPCTNGSLFNILTQAHEFLDGQNVVCGRVVEGMDTVMRIAKQPTNVSTDEPLKLCVIVDCGEC